MLKNDLKGHALVLSTILSLVAASAVYFLGGYIQHSLFIVFGLLYGYVIYRSRLCFATALYGNSILFTGILVSLLITSFTSYIIVKTGVNMPQSAPIGPHILIGSILFGMSMPFVGGCMTGTLFRLGGGQAKSLAAIFGILIGNLIGAGFLWRYIEPIVDVARGLNLLAVIGPELSLALNFSLIIPLIYLLRNRMRTDGGGQLVPHNSIRELSKIIRMVKEDPWPAWLGGAVLALIFTAQFALYTSPTIQVPLARAMLWLTSPIIPSADNPWVARFGLREPYNDPALLLVVAFVAGAAIASTTSGTFACFTMGRRSDIAIGFIAGMAMGVSVWIAVGCNVSGFWAAAATLRPEGWLYALGLFIGAKIGLKLYEKTIVLRM